MTEINERLKRRLIMIAQQHFNSFWQQLGYYRLDIEGEPFCALENKRLKRWVIKIPARMVEGERDEQRMYDCLIQREGDTYIVVTSSVFPIKEEVIDSDTVKAVALRVLAVNTLAPDGKKLEPPCHSFKELVDQHGLDRIVNAILLANCGALQLNSRAIYFCWRHVIDQAGRLEMEILGEDMNLYPFSVLWLLTDINLNGFMPLTHREWLKKITHA
jgi:hypothetical protein